MNELRDAIAKLKVVGQDISVVWRGRAGLEEELWAIKFITDCLTKVLEAGVPEKIDKNNMSINPNYRDGYNACHDAFTLYLAKLQHEKDSLQQAFNYRIDEIAKLESELAKLQAQLLNATNLLEICKGAIDDAIYCEDGLDGATGQDIIKLINELLKENPPKCQECDHLIQENLKIGAEKDKLQAQWREKIGKLMQAGSNLLIELNNPVIDIVVIKNQKEQLQQSIRFLITTIHKAMEK
jgi:hypothetical protein